MWPLNRSLTGDGNRESLRILSEIIPLEIKEIPSGTPCFDWQVPSEWKINTAWIKDSQGKTLIDFQHNNLHLMGYSKAVHEKMSFDQLKPHLYTLPDQPELIPYVTSYYQQRWGFCLSHHDFENLDRTEEYEVFIDAEFLEQGSMTVGEILLPGSTEEEVLFSTYICHPSLANNELSGPLVAAFLYDELRKIEKRKYTYRFLFAPETIGALYHLSIYGEGWKKNLKAGFVLTCVGDSGNFTYKRSRRCNSLADRAVELILKQTESDYKILDFEPRGSDERQYCSPGFNLPVGSLMRTKHGDYPEYHTSADNKDFISFEAMQASVEKYRQIVEVLEWNENYINRLPYGEPQLGRRGLYPQVSQKGAHHSIDAMMWLLNYSDGQHDLIEISEKSGILIKDLIKAVQKLRENGILTRSLPQKNHE